MPGRYRTAAAQGSRRYTFPLFIISRTWLRDALTEAAVQNICKGPAVPYYQRPLARFSPMVQAVTPALELGVKSGVDFFRDCS
jgi:hypothetical protein